MNLKLSKYNHFTKEGDFFIGYNFLKRSIIKTESQILVESLEKLKNDFSIKDLT